MASSPPPTASPPPNSTATAPPPATPTAAPPPSNNSSSSPPPPSPAPPSTPTPTPATPSAPPPEAPTTPSTASPAPPGTPPAPFPPTAPGTSTPGNRATPSPATAATPPPPPPSSSSGLSTPVVVGIAVGGLVLLLLGSILCVCLFRNKKKRRHHHHPPPPPPPHLLHYYGHPPPPPPPPPPHKGDQYQNWQHKAPPPPPPDHVVKMHSHLSPPPPPLNVHSSGSASNHSGGESRPPLSPGAFLSFSRSTFTYEQLVAATNGFSDANLLGQGGFGFVHKGVLPNGTEVAVKQLRDGSGQGEREFQAEVEIISRVHHKHLVSLVGYCISGANRLLVYEFVPNNTLEFHLHGRDRPTLDWPTRLKIALGSAKGLAYLHEDCHPKIIHRDIKASNILLDLRFEAKVADFGLAKFTSDTNTHVSTRVMGTFGSRQAPMDDNLVDWARPLMTKAFEDGNHDALVDPRLGSEYNDNEMARMIACAAACVRHSSRRRPRMGQVVRALEGDVSLDDLNEGVRPGHSRFIGSYGSSASDYDTNQYRDDLKKFRKIALGGSGVQSSSQHTPTTSEHGQNPSAASSSDGHQATKETELGSVKKDGDSSGDSQSQAS
nr:unnamed protein product [Digitaria exilis]